MFMLIASVVPPPRKVVTGTLSTLFTALFLAPGVVPNT